MAIKVNSRFPKQGVLVLLDREEKSGPFVIVSGKKYPIVSLRQPPELCGIDESTFDPSKKDEWIQPYREQFCDSLNLAVLKSGIDTLFIAAGGVPWVRSSYSSCMPQVSIVEISEDR